MTGTNFLVWYRNLRIILKHERKLYILDQSLSSEPAANASRADRTTFQKYVDDSVEVSCLMLATMIPGLQKDLELMDAHEMILCLKEMFQVQARQERYETTKALHSCKMAEGTSVSAHVLKMIGYLDHLARLGFPMSQVLAIDMIVNSLSSSYDQFVTNYNMNNMKKSVSELHGMLKTAEQNIKKPSSVLMGVVGVEKERGKARAKVGLARCQHLELLHWMQNPSPSQARWQRMVLAFTAMSLVIGSEIASSILRKSRGKRPVTLVHQVFSL